MHESGEYAIPDIGRMHLTGNESDRGAFKTPTLRNLRDTTPYFHNGSVVELKAAVQFIVNGGQPNPNLSPLVRKLDLTDAEVDDLVAFLDSLHGDLPDVALDHLPE
jgi:cytochrome c peroxidase